MNKMRSAKILAITFAFMATIPSLRCGAAESPAPTQDNEHYTDTQDFVRQKMKIYLTDAKNHAQIVTFLNARWKTISDAINGGRIDPPWDKYNLSQLISVEHFDLDVANVTFTEKPEVIDPSTMAPTYVRDYNCQIDKERKYKLDTGSLTTEEYESTATKSETDTTEFGAEVDLKAGFSEGSSAGLKVTYRKTLIDFASLVYRRKGASQIHSNATEEITEPPLNELVVIKSTPTTITPIESSATILVDGDLYMDIAGQHLAIGRIRSYLPGEQRSFPATGTARVPKVSPSIGIVFVKFDTTQACLVDQGVPGGQVPPGHPAINKLQGPGAVLKSLNASSKQTTVHWSFLARPSVPMSAGATCSYDGQDYSVGSRVCQGGRVMKCQEDGTWGQTSDNCETSAPDRKVSQRAAMPAPK